MTWYKGKMAELRKERGGRCLLGLAHCSETKRLEFAHVKETGLKGRGRGRAERYRDIKANPECYILACRSCHLRADELARVFYFELQLEALF